MIEWFRGFSQTWVARGFFLALAIIFMVMWGGGDLSRQFFNQQPHVATVGPDKISAWDFFQELQRVMQHVQLSTQQPMDEQKAKAMGLYAHVRDKLIDEKLIELEADRLGLFVSDREIRRLIKSDKIFQNDGIFQEDKFHALLKNIGYTEATYIKALRKDVLKNRLVKAWHKVTKIPMTMAVPLFSWQNEKRHVRSVIMSTDSISLNIKPTLDELKTFYEAEKKNLVAPEYRTITLISIDQKALMDVHMIRQSDLKDYFETHKQNFPNQSLNEVKGVIETQLKRERTIDSFQKLINQIEDLMGQGKTLEELSKEMSLPLKTYKAVDDKGSPDPFGVEETVSSKDIKAIQEAFGLDQGSHSAPIESAEGYYCFTRVDQIKPSHTRVFDTIQPKLTDMWLFTKKLEALQKKANALVQDIRKGTPLEGLAGRSNLKIIKAQVTRSGPLASSALTLSKSHISTIYTLKPHDAIAMPYTLNDKEGTFIVMEVIDSEAPSLKDAAKIQDFQAGLQNAIIDDIFVLYIHALKKRFPVDINHHFFASK